MHLINRNIKLLINSTNYIYREQKLENVTT